MAENPNKKTTDLKFKGAVGCDLVVSRSFKKDGEVYNESETRETVTVSTLPDNVPQAAVKYSGGVTLSLGRGTYEFARLDVGVELPCVLGELEECYAAAAKFVDERLNSGIEDIRKFAATRGGE